MATVAVPSDLCKTLTADLYGAPDVGFPDLEQATRPERAAYHQAAQPEPLPEAAFSLTIHGSIGGHPAMLTIRGQNPQTFAANVAAMRGMLDAAPVAAPVAQLAAQPSAPAAPAAMPEGWCAVHSVQMKRQSNDRGSWFSHKCGDTWCRGK